MNKDKGKNGLRNFNLDCIFKMQIAFGDSNIKSGFYFIFFIFLNNSLGVIEIGKGNVEINLFWTCVLV